MKVQALVRSSVVFFLCASHGLTQELKEVTVCKAPSFSVQKMVIDPSGKILFVGGGDANGAGIIVFDLGNGKEIGRLAGFQYSLDALELSPDGKWIARRRDVYGDDLSRT